MKQLHKELFRPYHQNLITLSLITLFYSAGFMFV